MKKSLLFFAWVSLCLLSNQLDAQQWIVQPSNINPNNYVQFIDAVDTNVVWGLASDRTSQQNPVQEFTRTTNGGQTWTAGTITNAANHGPSCIMALNADTAWVAMFNVSGGGSILRTNDGGVSWTKQTTATFTAPNGFPNVVHFFNANEGFCMGDPNGGYFEIYTTADGGNNWIRVPQANIAANLTGEFGITDVYTNFGDSTVYFGTNKGRIYKSADRGANWTVSSTPYTGYIGAITFRDANFGIACEADNATTSTDLIITNDGGATWNLLPTSSAGFTMKQSIRFVPGTDSTFVITSPYTIYGSAFSVDNGSNWRLMDNLIHSDCDFVNATTGWSGGGELNSPIYKWTGPMTIAANDATVKSIDVRSAVGTGTQTPMATVLNNGLTTQTFNVTMDISGGYTSTKTVSNLAFNQTQQISFDPWTPGATGSYNITVYSQLATDSDLSNDTLNKSTTAFNELPNYGWTSKTSAAIATFGGASAFIPSVNAPLDSGYLFSDGGSDLSIIQPKNERFDEMTNNWTSATDMPIGVYQFSMHGIQNMMYAIGGYSSGFVPSPTNYIYNPQTNSWTSGAVMPQPVGDYASGIYNDSLIYFIGGYDGTNDLNTVQIYNPATDSWSMGTPKPGTAVSGFRGGIYNNFIVVTCGYSQTLQGAIDETWIGQIDPANPTSIAWLAAAPYPGGTMTRFAGGGTFKNSLPYVVFTAGDPTGGGTEVKDDVWAYDLNNNEWLVGPPKPTACSNVSNFTGVVSNDSLYMVVVGGYNGVGTTGANEWLNLGASPFVGVKELSSQLVVAVSPNPVSDILTVQIPSPLEMTTLAVFDLNGRVVKEIQANSNKVQIVVRDLDNGVYILKLSDKKNSSTARFTVMH